MTQVYFLEGQKPNKLFTGLSMGRFLDNAKKDNSSYCYSKIKSSQRETFPSRQENGTPDLGGREQTVELRRSVTCLRSIPQERISS